MGQETSLITQGANTAIGMYSANQQAQQIKYDIKRESALRKTQLLEDYRIALGTSMAQGASSGFTQSGNLAQVNDANALTLQSDIDAINSQANSQIKLAKLSGRAQMANIFSDTSSSIGLDYQEKKNAWDKLGNPEGEEFDYFNPTGKKSTSSLGDEL